MPALDSVDKDPIQKVTFVLHDEQTGTVERAIGVAKLEGPFDSVNKNANGNAIARICEAYLNAHGDC
jgi:hypothetical protein